MKFFCFIITVLFLTKNRLSFSYAFNMYSFVDECRLVRDEKVLINQQETLSIQLTLHRIILAVRF
jgi:hypothetical protein